MFDAVAAHLREHPDIGVWVDAHVDRQPDVKAAKRATQSLAERAVAELVRRGVPRERLDPRGIGHDMPRADDRHPEGRAANRRVELVPKPPTQPPNPCI